MSESKRLGRMHTGSGRGDENNSGRILDTDLNSPASVSGEDMSVYPFSNVRKELKIRLNFFSEISTEFSEVDRRKKNCFKRRGEIIGSL